MKLSLNLFFFIFFSKFIFAAEKIIDPNLEFEAPDDLIGKILQVGKKKFLRVSN